MAFTENSKLKELLANEEAVKILEKYLPGISTNPMISMANSFTLKQLSAIPQANIPEELVSVILSDLSSISTTAQPSSAETVQNRSNNLENGLVAIVTGAGGGIGRAACLKLSESGFKIVAVDFNTVSGTETVNLIQQRGGESLFLQADVTKEEDVERYTKATVEAYGRIDVFFNNAGVLQNFSLLENLETMEFDRVMNVNVRGSFLGLKKVLSIMNAQGFGSIINTASTAGIRAEHSMSAYTASKHAVIGLTKAAAIEYVRKGIRVNAICPGGVDTALTQSVPTMMQESGYTPEEFPNMRIGRFAEPSEIAEIVDFLASDKSRYITGSIIAVDGGLTL